ncbi:VPEID-CTERM sorting domain-containing protein [Methyloglobulus sp.]|uniref:VPEID-CTERM sorting domain-containing protein n=1 Tax=Methyloglobulus sp. TaxID=2518622 RepID=UPI0032B75912
MKIQLTFTAIAVGLLLASNIAMADKDKGKDKGGHRTEVREISGKRPKFPEISIASGTSAIALLAGALLLVGERSRSRRS